MARETSELTVGDMQFSTQQLPVLRAYKMLAKLSSTIASGNVKTVFDMMGGLAPDTADLFVMELLVSTTAKYDGRVVSLSTRDAISNTFDGRLPVLLEVLGWVLEFNFSSFYLADTQSASVSNEPPSATPPEKLPEATS